MLLLIPLNFWLGLDAFFRAEKKGGLWIWVEFTRIFRPGPDHLKLEYLTNRIRIRPNFEILIRIRPYFKTRIRPFFDNRIRTFFLNRVRTYIITGSNLILKTGSDLFLKTGSTFL